MHPTYRRYITSSFGEVSFDTANLSKWKLVRGFCRPSRKDSSLQKFPLVPFLQIHKNKLVHLPLYPKKANTLTFSQYRTSMGKENFSKIYRDACNELGTSSLTLKLSHYCSSYNPRKNYAGLIVYHHDGKFKWHNSSGIAKGFNCRSMYVLILCTDDWPPEAFTRAGQGLVHDHMYRKMFNRPYDDKVTCCGGFAIMKGVVKYSSIWLNKQSSNRTRKSWTSDGNKNLSNGEQALVNLAISEWRVHGGGKVVRIPDSLNRTLKNPPVTDFIPSLVRMMRDM